MVAGKADPWIRSMRLLIDCLVLQSPRVASREPACLCRDRVNLDGERDVPGLWLGRPVAKV
jgi:hypothetical protein